MNDVLPVLLVLTAYVSRYLAGRCYDTCHPELGLALFLLRAFIYAGLFAAWGVSVHHRIVQKRVRMYMMTVAVLALFWLIIRTLKFHFVSDPNVMRYLWYAYYIPNLLIPLNALFVALYVGKPENYRIPKRAYMLYIPALLLIFLVLTNDFHQLVFTFPADALVYTDKDYEYNIGFVFVFVYRIVIILSALTIFIIKQRNKNLRKILVIPMIPLILNAAYSLLYCFEFEWLRNVFGDTTVMECVLNIVFLECCIRTRLIQSNTRYDELFRMGNIRTVIVNEKYEQLIASNNYTALPVSTLRSAEAAPVLLENNIRLSSAPIKNGRVLWQDDVSELVSLLAELKELNKSLKTKSQVAKQEYETERRRKQTEEKKRLYETVLSQTKKDIRLYAELADELKQENNPDNITGLICRISVVLAYIKRRINLVFLFEENDKVSAEELRICIEKDSLPSIRQFGVSCECTSGLHSVRPLGEMIMMYESFHAITMTALDTLKSLTVQLYEAKGQVLMVLRLVCDADLSAFVCENIAAEHKGDEWVLTVTEKGGAGV